MKKGDQNDDTFSKHPFSFSATAIVMFSSWLNRHRLSYFLLILTLPFILPLFFAVEICFQMYKRRRKVPAKGGRIGRHRLEKGGDELQRYLEDQLLLVVRSGYERGDDDDSVGSVDWVNVERFDSSRTLLQ